MQHESTWISYQVFLMLQNSNHLANNAKKNHFRGLEAVTGIVKKVTKQKTKR